MKAAGARTLGEYFAGLNPEEERIRRRWTSRQMYLDEFEHIWSTQSCHYHVLSEDLKEKIKQAIFHQRPLKPQDHLIGQCELCEGARRAPAALRVAQRFRLLQKVNDLIIYEPGKLGRKPTPSERQCLIEALEANGDMTFAAIRGKKVLNLPKETTFNLQEGGEKKMPGNRTDATLASIFGNRWKELSEDDREQVVEDVLTFEKEEAFYRRARGHWKLDAEAARRLAETQLEPDFSRLSRKALSVLVERMKDGTPYMTARKECFPESFQATDPVDVLPPVIDAVRDLRNPAVCRALTELRKLVNAIIRQYGKPERIHIELARDLKKSRKRRQETSTRNRQNEKRREDAKRRILNEMRINHPSRVDIEKVLLAEECNWICPYTGQTITMQDLFGEHPQYDIEHIWPMSRSMDNTYLNKTLCHHAENRDRKRNRTPWEAYAQDERRWEEIIDRVKRFSSDSARIKLQRFLSKEIPEGFTLRHLQDTRYTSRLAAEYLGLLYGGQIDNQDKRRIQTNTGGITHHLRNEWGLNGILDDGGTKTRDDHRHHAVDAVVIALSSPAVIQQLERAAAEATPGRRLFAPIKEPWVGFFGEVRENIEKINVSRRANRKIAGKLHAESLYSKPIPGGGEHRHIRKELQKLTRTELANDTIVDPVVRERVRRKYDECGGGDPAKVFAEPDTHPTMRTKTGRKIPIHKVRIKTRVKKPWSIGKGARQRNVAPSGGSNHHIAIIANLDTEGNETGWEGHLVSRFKAHERKREGVPVVQVDWGKGKRFKFSLAPNDFVLIAEKSGEECLYRVSGISEGDIECRLHTDGRLKKDLKRRTRLRGGSLKRMDFRKVRVTYLGEVIPAND